MKDQDWTFGGRFNKKNPYLHLGTVPEDQKMRDAWQEGFAACLAKFAACEECGKEPVLCAHCASMLRREANGDDYST